jgi:acyl-CoA synthetase (AMP-forming)/AMP-acid ligase II/thioesterase domain-containing protein
VSRGRDCMTQHRVPHVVAAMAATSARTPDAVVLEDDEESVTARELTEWAGAVASRLDGTAPGGITVVLADRRVASVAAVFGAMWAGHALAILDPDDPKARLAELVARVRPAHVIDGTGTVGGEWFGHRVIDAVGVSRTRVEPVAVAADALRLLVFTSGSTGRPKAVPRRAAASDDYFDLRRARSDDLATRAVLMPLQFLGGFAAALDGPAVGRRSILIDPRTTAPERIAERIDQANIETLGITPSLGRTLARAIGGRRMESVRIVAAAGEASDWADVELIRTITSPDMVYRSSYSASEAHRAMTRLEIPPDEPIGVGRVRLGPLTEPAIDRLEPVDGADDVFELIVRRDIVEGYWDDPELTADRFGVDDDGVPFWRSGDLVSLDDGVVHLRGRADDMVKVNGRLVEPAEAERVIRNVPGVRAAVVVPRTLSSGRQQLVGHVEAGADVSVDAIRSALLESLPPVLTPGVLVRHDALPLGDRGKLDRQSMRTAVLRPWRDDLGEAPVSPLERSITDVAARCLEVDDLAPTDDLWALGCDSLAAVEIAQAISAIHDASIQPNDLIASPTPRAIAVRITDAVPSDHGGVIIANANGSSTPLHLVAGAGGPAVQYHCLALALGPDQPVVIHEQAGLHRRWPIDLSVTAAARRHVEVISQRWPSGPVVLAGHSYGGVVANVMASMLAELGRCVELIVLDAGLPTGGWRRVRTQRSGPALAHVRGRVRLRLANARKLVRVVIARPDTAKRYNALIVPASWQVARHRGVAFGGPTTVIAAAERTGPVRWPATGHVTFVSTPGDHNSMLKPPHVAALAEAMTRAITEAITEAITVTISEAPSATTMRAMTGASTNRPGSGAAPSMADEPGNLDVG